MAPGEPCTPAAIQVTPSGTLRPGQQFTLSTSGQRPTSLVNFYVADAVVGSVTTDAAGAASVATQAPKGFTGEFIVAAAGACGTVTAVVDPRGSELGRGFARTGFGLLPLLVAALALIIVGFQLVRTVEEVRPRVGRRGTPTRRWVYSMVAHTSTAPYIAETRR